MDEIYPDVQCAPVEKLTSPTDGCVSSGTLVTVTAGTIRSGVDFSLATGSTIAANVTDLSGHGLAGSSGYQVYSAAGVKLTMALGFLPAGTFFVRSFNDQGYIDERYDNQPCVPASLCDAGIAGSTPIVVGVAEQVGPINLALAQGGRIAGVIKNAATNAPAAGVPVRIFDTAGQFISDAVSDSVGAYVSRAGLPSGTYYLRTVNAPGFQDALYNGFACAPSCTVTSGTPVSVTIAQTTTGIDFALQPKPGAFTKTSPIDGAMGLLTSVTLTWTASAAATSYAYCIDTTNDGACSNWISTGMNTSVVPSGLAIGMTYFWHVRAMNAYGTTYSDGGETKGYRAFSTLGYPAAFSKMSPANGGTQGTTMTLSWAISSGAASYEYCIDTTNDNACSNWTSTGSATSAVVIDSSPYFSKYYWHVRAINAIGTTYSNGSATAFWTFDHGGYPNLFERSSPANGSAVSSSSPVTLTWNASFGATSYSYCIDTVNDNTCNGGGWIPNGANTSVTLNGLQADVTYYWHVMAINACCAMVAGGDPAVFWSFTPQNPQGAFGKLAPLNGASGISNPTFNWEPSTGATSYEFCIGTSTNCLWTNVGLTTSVGGYLLNAGTTYYWQVAALNSSGRTYANGSSNAFWNFTTAGRRINTPTDFDGDGRADLAVYRPSEGRWYVKTSGSGFASGVGYSWGVSTDLPAPGDYDGDGKADLAVFRPSTGSWFILKSSTNFTSWQAFQWGMGGDILVQGDYDGDGKTDIAMYRPSSGAWYILKSSSGFTTYSTYSWGTPGDVPVTGDFDGDSRSDIAIFRPSSGQWFILKSSGNFTTWDTRQWGVAGDITVPGDYDGDGKTDIAVYRPSEGRWYVLKSSTGFSGYSAFAWGVAGDVPVPSDYDGDGKTDVAIYRPSTGYWFVLKSSSNFASYGAYQWGVATDVPVLGRH